jgi:hypothetical protein
MALGFMVTLTAFFLKNQYLLGPVMAQHLGFDRGPRDQGMTNLDRWAIGQQKNLVQNDFVPHVGL